MIKKTILTLIVIFNAFNLSVKAEISNDSLRSIGRFLVVDFLTAKSYENRKPLTNVFYVKETGDEYQITDDDLELTNMKGIISPGEYKQILIINEISGLGLLARKATINEKNQILWIDNTSSLMKFMFTPYMGNVSSGVTPLMKYGDADKIANIFTYLMR